jgi:hypothetical protein
MYDVGMERNLYLKTGTGRRAVVKKMIVADDLSIP